MSLWSVLHCVGLREELERHSVFNYGEKKNCLFEWISSEIRTQNTYVCLLFGHLLKTR